MSILHPSSGPTSQPGGNGSLRKLLQVATLVSAGALAACVPETDVDTADVPLPADVGSLASNYDCLEDLEPDNDYDDNPDNDDEPEMVAVYTQVYGHDNLGNPKRNTFFSMSGVTREECAGTVGAIDVSNAFIKLDGELKDTVGTGAESDITNGTLFIDDLNAGNSSIDSGIRMITVEGELDELSSATTLWFTPFGLAADNNYYGVGAAGIKDVECPNPEAGDESDQPCTYNVATTFFGE